MNLISQKQKAWALYQDGEFEKATRVCVELCNTRIADAEVFYLLGSCYGMLRRYNEAMTAFHISLKMQPDMPQTLLSLGGVLVSLNRIDEAIITYKSALELKPNMAEIHCVLAQTLLINDITSEAREHFESAISLQSDMAQAYMGRAGLLLSIDNDFDAALKSIQSAIDLKPENPEYKCSMGIILLDIRRYEDALSCFNDALQLAPEFPAAIGGLARFYGLKGEYNKSMEQIDLLRRKNIYNDMAALSFTIICKHLGNCDEAIEYAKKTLEILPLDKRSREALHMHMARVLDRLDRYDEAWVHFTEGNKLTEKLYDTAEHSLRTSNMIKVFSHAGMLGFSRSTIDTKRPIFIVGMPRSGTSLVEQILAAHPDVCGGGELSFVTDLRSIIIQESGADGSWPNCVEKLRSQDLNQLATRYLDQINALSDTAPRITDKMPHNYFELGLIQMLFPNAQIIHCNRNPMDTCLSIYFQNFLDEHDYSRNLYNIGSHYHQYLKLMQHWRSHLSIPFLDVQYEELVSDPEHVVKQMLNHCNLEWHADCLKFHKSKRQVHTASFDQVRQPIYTRSVERWKHYEKHLDELKAGLKRGF
jgi:tetratricopeptide (TPR) repeat protein